MPKPAIFIPGFPASELYDSTTNERLYPPNPLDLLDPAKKESILKRLEKIDGVRAGNPILATLRFFGPAASTLFAILRDDYGYDITDDNPNSANFCGIGWDWRQSIASDDTIARIKKALDSLSPSRDGKVVAIVHSTGGLVFRAFLEKNPEYLPCFEQVLALGVPWCGTLEALNALSKGAAIHLGPLPVPILTAEDSFRILRNAQALYDLLPRCKDMNLVFVNGQAGTPFDDQSWLPPQFAPMFAKAYGPFSQTFDALPVTNVCGWGGDTWPVATIQDGVVTIPPPENDKGDATVNYISASWLKGAKVRTIALPIGAFVDAALPQVHRQLWAPPAMRQIFDEVLKDAPRQPFVCAAADKDQYIDPRADPVMIRIGGTAADGTPLPNGKVSYKLGPTPVSNPFGAERQMDIRMPRSAFQQDPAPNIRRIELRVTWDGGGPKTLPIQIQIA